MINGYHLSANPSDAAIDLLMTDPTRYLNATILSRNTNPRVMSFFERVNVPGEHRPKYNWSFLSANPADWAMDMMDATPWNIDWYMLSKNPSDRALDRLIANPEKIVYTKLAENTSERAMEMMKSWIAKTHLSSISPAIWRELSKNPANGAMDLLEQWPDKIVWAEVCQNPSPRAFALLAQNPDKICPRNMCCNPSVQAVPILAEWLNTNPANIEWSHLCRYHAHHFPELFATLDYRSVPTFRAELSQTALNPNYLSNLATKYGVPFKDILLSI